MNMNQSNIGAEEIDLRAYVEILARRWKTIVAVTLVFLATAYVYTLLKKPVYEARATVLIRAADGDSALGGIAGAFRRVAAGGMGGTNSDLMELIKSHAVAGKVLDDLKLTERIKGWNNKKLKRIGLAGSVSRMLKPVKMSGNLMELRVEASEPRLAADVANGYAEALAYYWNELNATQAQRKLKYIAAELPRVETELGAVEERLKIAPRSSGSILGAQGGIQRDFEIYNSVYMMLRKEYESTKLDAAKDVPPFTVIDAAVAPTSPSKPKMKVNMMAGLVVGLCSGFLLAFFQEYMAKRGQG
ncbi:MAG: Wzz/FepE/Etk N-terminal domain-containing protein [Candidatus Margulisiibacteriota bacterium]